MLLVGVVVTPVWILKASTVSVVKGTSGTFERGVIRAIGVTSVAVVASLWSIPAGAWDYDEHKATTCIAAQTVCQALELARTRNVASPEATDQPLTDLDLDRRIRALESVLCRPDCGGVNPLERRALFPAPPGRDCPLNFGDAVALVDNENDPLKLEDMQCDEVGTKLKESIEKQAWESLIADEHFAPKNRAGIRHAYEVARARMLYAGQFEGTLPSPVQTHQAPLRTDESRQSLIATARLLHLLEDSFAAGHNVARLDNAIDPHITTVIHDRYNDKGVMLYSSGGVTEPWFALGDHRLNDERNRVNKARAEFAATQALCTLASIYVGLVEGLPDCPMLKGELEIVIPELVPQKVNTLDGSRLSFDYMYTSYVHEHAYVYRSSFHSFSATFEWPFLSFLSTWGVSLRAGPTIEVYSRRGARWPAVLAGETEHAQWRMLGGHLGLGLVTPCWWRALRFGAYVDAQLGWHPDASISPSNRVRWADGFNTNVNTEFLLYYAAIRVGWNMGYRRSALDVNQLDFNTGPSISAVWRPNW